MAVSSGLTTLSLEAEPIRLVFELRKFWALNNVSGFFSCVERLSFFQRAAVLDACSGFVRRAILSFRSGFGRFPFPLAYFGDHLRLCESDLERVVAVFKITQNGDQVNFDPKTQIELHGFPEVVVLRGLIGQAPDFLSLADQFSGSWDESGGEP
jgi:hypothetical protein